ncbi:tetratricopeptide repeat protein [Ghiorsea bivora]|uniref:tetratricopeptide repeat protein n=1 Tax=Ghiorsea bivora TaxID=1485545 RepID=UPI0012FD512D|nr:tetratricopeptide repeat protein [Ghiorsea bivora]
MFDLTALQFMPNISRMLAASTDNMEGLDASSSQTQENSPVKPRIWLGVKKGLQAAKDAIENKDLTLAEELLREVIEFAPAEPETWHILAAILNRQGQVDEAKVCLRRVIKLKETNIELQTDLPVSKRMAKLLWAQDEQAAALAMLAQLLLDASDDRELLALQQTWTASS